MDELLNPKNFLDFLPYGFVGLGAICLIVFLAIALLTKNNRFSLSLAIFLSVVVLASGFYLRILEMRSVQFVEELPPSVCTTSSGEIGHVRIVTAIFNRPDGSFHGFEQEHVKLPGEYGISNDEVRDLSARPGSYLDRHWGAK